MMLQQLAKEQGFTADREQQGPHGVAQSFVARVGRRPTGRTQPFSCRMYEELKLEIHRLAAEASDFGWTLAETLEAMYAVTRREVDKPGGWDRVRKLQTKCRGKLAKNCEKTLVSRRRRSDQERAAALERAHRVVKP